MTDASPVELLTQVLYDDLDLAGVLENLRLGLLPLPNVQSVTLDPWLPYDLRVAAVFRARLELKGESADLWLVYGFSTIYWQVQPCITPPDPTSAAGFYVLNDEGSALVVLDHYQTKVVRSGSSPASWSRVDWYATQWIERGTTSELPPIWQTYLSMSDHLKGEIDGEIALSLLAHGLHTLTRQHGEKLVTSWIPQINQGLEGIFR